MPSGHYIRKPRNTPKVVLTCCVCSKDFSMLASVYRQRKTKGVKYCSKACMAIAYLEPDKHADLKCRQCGEAFSKRIDHVREWNFCSAACRDDSRRRANAKWRNPVEIKKYMTAYHKRYLIENRGRMNTRTAQRRHRKRLATVLWSDADAIKAFYIEAQRMTKATGIPHEVDHIVPITHDDVCGLHNEFNLQVITKEANQAKRNLFNGYATRPNRRGTKEFRIKQRMVKGRYGVELSLV